MKKQTAIEWLVEHVNSDCLNSTFIRPELIRKAKAMEKEQMIDFAQKWQDSPIEKYDCKEDLYNETYEINKSNESNT